jgi:hypothetical protein
MNIPAMKALAQQLIHETRYPANERSWAALRTTTVRNNNHITIYSVLGVMADIYIRAKQPGNPAWEEMKLDEPHKFRLTTTYDLEETRESWILDIPDEVLNWYGVTREQSTQFCMLAMRGFSFQQIGMSILKAVEKQRGKVA